MPGNDGLMNMKKNYLQTLYKKYEALYKQLATTLNEVDKISLRENIKNIEQEIAEVKTEIAKLSSLGEQFAQQPEVETPIIENNKLSPINLTGSRQKEFSEALMSAFPSEKKLEMMLFHDELEWKLNQIASGDNYQEVVFSLIVYAQSQGKIRELLEAAKRANPGNLKLSNFYLLCQLR